MADWFETRFREPIDAGLDPAFAARMRALVVEEWQADAGSSIPAAGTDLDDPEGDIIMLDTEDRPSSGNQPASPRNGLPGRWLLVAAAVAVIAIVGAVLAAGGDDEDKIDTVNSVPAAPTDISEVDGVIEPGAYFIDPDADPATPLRVTFEVAAEGWGAWLGTSKEVPGAGRVILSITTIDNVTREACSDHRPAEPAVGPTVDDLAAALSALAPFEVTSPPSDVTIAGYQGKHLELTVPDLRVVNQQFADCGGNLHSWIAPHLDDSSFWGYDNSRPGGTEEFWILDVDGTRLVLVTDQSTNSRPEDLAEMEAIFDSIRIEP